MKLWLLAIPACVTRAMPDAERDGGLYPVLQVRPPRDAGVQLPWALRSYRDGTLTEDIRYTAIRIDTPVDERLFAVN